MSLHYDPKPREKTGPLAQRLSESPTVNGVVWGLFSLFSMMACLSSLGVHTEWFDRLTVIGLASLTGLGAGIFMAAGRRTFPVSDDQGKPNGPGVFTTSLAGLAGALTAIIESTFMYPSSLAGIWMAASLLVPPAYMVGAYMIAPAAEATFGGFARLIGWAFTALDNRLAPPTLDVD